jgi:propanol-preferring alcohol dehydrogenase
MTCSWKGLPFPTPAGQVGGHEGVGKIVKLGPGSAGVKIGDRVGIKWMADICGSCRMFTPPTFPLSIQTAS